MVQAFRNEDTSGDASKLRLEIRRLKHELQFWKEAANKPPVPAEFQSTPGSQSYGFRTPRSGSPRSRHQSFGTPNGHEDYGTPDKGGYSPGGNLSQMTPSSMSEVRLTAIRAQG